jgi:CotS family spore coat protein
MRVNDRGLSVLEQYNLKVYNTYRGRGCMICETDQGLKLIKEFHGSKTKLAFQNKVLKHVKTSGYKWVDVVLENKEELLISMDKDEVPYIVKDWFDGRECDTKNEGDILRGVRNLASLHQVMQLIPGEEEEWISTADLIGEYEKHNRELKKIRNFIRNKRKKNEFELCFIDSFKPFFEQGQEILEQLKNTGYGSLRSQSLTLGGVCHGDYNHHNILIHKDGIATTNFDRCHYNLQISDLYQFMRKILEKQNWDENLGMAMIDEYDKVKSISGEELENLYFQLSYPEKFWKIANHYFNNNKAWIPGKSKEKLENLSRQFSKREKFLKKLL